MALAAVMMVSGCKKQPEAATTTGAAETKPVAGAAAPVARAANLGFASHLPANTEAYFGTVNLKAHAVALKESNYFKDITAFMDDRVPAPAAGSPLKNLKAKGLLDQLEWEDMFVSMGKGGAKSLGNLMKFSSLYKEFSYRTLMRGASASAGAAGGPMQGMDPFKLLGLLDDPELVKRAADIISELELPPVMIGWRFNNPEEALKKLMAQTDLSETRAKAKVSLVTTSLSGHFTVMEVAAKDGFTDELKKRLLSLLPPESASLKPVLESTFAALQAKRFTVTYGTAGGYVIFAIGSTRPDLEFITDGGASLTARPEFSVMTPYQGKDTAAVMYVEGGTLQALQDPEPMQPIVRGLLAGLKQSPVFSGMAKALEPKAAALAPLERKMHETPFTTLVGVGWWDKGLHMEFDGGISPKGLEGSKQLKFASLVTDPNVVMAANYHGDVQSSAALRDYVEAWAALLRMAGLELAKANLFGEQGEKMSTWIDLEIVPQLVAFYNASKTMYGKALGNEHAWVVDLGGRMPALPGMPPPSPGVETKMLRLVAIDDVTDRKLIGDSWTQMNTSLNGVAKAFPMLAGQVLPQPEISSKAGAAFYNYQLPFESDDLTLCSSVSDKVFMVGTSKALQEDIAGRLLRAAPSADTSTMLWRVSWPNMRTAIKGFAPEAPAAEDNIKALSKWMAPLGEMRGRVWIEAGHVRNSISWELKDTTKFD